MTQITLRSYEIHMLKQAAREMIERHQADTPAEGYWRRREGKALESAVEKMTNATQAEIQSVIRKTGFGSAKVTEMPKKNPRRS